MASIKTLTFAACHFSIAFGVAYLLTGDLGISSALALIEPACNTVAYYLHERVWNRVSANRPLPPTSHVHAHSSWHAA